MSMKAIKALYSKVISLAPALRAASANGATIDFANCIENEIDIIPGVWTDGTHTFTVQDSPDGVTFNNAAPANIVGTLNPITSAATAVVQKCSYIGPYRYVRVNVAVAGAATGALYAVIASVKPHKQPAP